MRSVLVLVLLSLFTAGFCPARSKRPLSQEPPLTSEHNASDITGMYSFLHEGEFVQVTIEADGTVSGFVSRYGESESDKGRFLDHFFETGSYDGQKLSFRTKVVHDISFEFSGSVLRGPVASPSKEGYWMLQGTLTESKRGADGKFVSRSRKVELKSFPQDFGDESTPSK